MTAARREPVTREALQRVTAQIRAWDKQSVAFDAAIQQIHAHDAAQRETIARLEEKIERMSRLATPNQYVLEQNKFLQTRLTASEAKRKWTKKPPTEEGFYWLRAPKHGWRDAVVWIEKDGDGPESYFYMPDDDSTPVDEVDGEWQGPLTPGEE